MAKLEQTIQGDFDEILQHIQKGILMGSESASLEEKSDFQDNGARCSVRVFERYSLTGGNRLSLSVTLFQNGGDIHLSAVTAGGSRGAFLKVNTFGEDSFLNELRKVLKKI